MPGTCLSGATTASPKTLLGYATDGYPVYGYAADSSGRRLYETDIPTIASNESYKLKTPALISKKKFYLQ